MSQQMRKEKRKETYRGKKRKKCEKGKKVEDNSVKKLEIRRNKS